MEFRFAELAEVEGRTLTGLALPFEREGRVGNMRERFARGSVASSGSAILNVQHDRGRAIAREPETLTFEVTDSGLLMRATLPATREADDTLALVRAKVLRGLSVEFLAQRERVVAGVRVIERGTVYGLAVVDHAAYPDATVAARAADMAGIHHDLPLWVFA